MAIKPFNSVGGYSVGPNLTEFIDANNNANIANLTVGGTANLANVTLSGNIAAGNITANSTLAGANLTISDTGNITSTLFVGGNVTANANLAVTDNANVTGTLFVGGNVTANANLVVTTNANIGGTSNVVGTAEFGNTVDITGILTTTTDANIGGNLTVTGDTNLDGTLVTISTGDLVLNQSLTTHGNVIMDADVAGGGAITIGSTAATKATNVSISGANVTLGEVANLHILGGSNLQFLQTDGAGNLVWATPGAAAVANGTSNVSIDTLNGPVTVGVGGVANVLVVTTTGADVTGTANVTGNITGANLVTAGNVYAENIVNTTGVTSIGMGNGSGILALTVAGNSTQFLPSGQINLGGVSTIAGGTFAGSQLVLGTTQTDLVQSRGGPVTVQVGTSGTTTSTWTFGNNGNLSAPGDINTTANVSAGNLAVTSNVTFANASGANVNATYGITTANLTANALVTLGAVANVKITGGSNLQFLQTDGTGNLVWATVDTDTLANGTSNVSIDTANGNVTVGVAGNANVAVFSGTGLTVQSNIAAGNITLTANVTTANLTANALVTLGNVANVKITGGANGLALTTDGTGNLAWTNQSLKYTREWHVSPTNGNDTTGLGSYNFPYATIMKAHSMASSGDTIFLHNGVYTENVTLTKTNLDVIGLTTGGLVSVTGTWAVGTTTPASIRISDIGCSGAFTQNGTGRLFIRRSILSSTFTRTSGEYTQFDEVDAAGTGIAINSGGTCVFNSGSQNFLQISNASAIVTINNSMGIGTAVVTAGTLFLNSSFVYSATNTTPSITSSAGSVVYMFNALSITPSNTPARVSLGGFWSINGSSYDRANSTLSANNLGTVMYNDAINTHGLANVSSLQVRGTSSLGPVGNVTITGGTSGQFLQTNGSGVLTWATASVASLANGTSNVNIATANGNVTVGANGQGNIITVASNGTYATTTVLDDMLVTGNLTVQGNTITINVTELNVEDPIITEGRGANNQPLTTNDGKDRGLFSYYYDGAELGGFIGLRTTGAQAGQYILSANATVTDNAVTVNTYGNLILGNVIGNLANGNSSVSIASANGAITLNPTGTANVVVATTTGIDVTGSVKVRTVTSIDAATVTTTNATPTTLASITDAAGLAVEFVVKGFNTTDGKFETFTILAISSGGACDYTIFGNTQIGGSPGSAIVSVVSGNMVLTVTSTAAASNTVWAVQYRTV